MPGRMTAEGHVPSVVIQPCPGNRSEGGQRDASIRQMTSVRWRSYANVT